MQSIFNYYFFYLILIFYIFRVSVHFCDIIDNENDADNYDIVPGT